MLAILTKTYFQRYFEQVSYPFQNTFQRYYEQDGNPYQNTFGSVSTSKYPT